MIVYLASVLRVLCERPCGDYKQYLKNNPSANQGDAGAYALMTVFGSAINVYFAPTGSTTYLPLTITTVTTTNTDGTTTTTTTITKTPCPNP